ncbi:autotransporter domain-containing protein [Microvirga antarctica]|uniref:autotransporter domain-containing protein n=1 Tax=Microvirga antarctica TaxID=2819233 RepID=UPI001B30B72C|nr:autotransporter domain-containing protein [Microvirga antarctica]
MNRTNTAMRSELGVKTAVTMQVGGRAMTVFADLGWSHDFLHDMTFAASLSPVPAASFSVSGAREEREAALVAAVIDYQMSSKVSLSGRLDGTLADNSRTYGFSAALKVRF